RGGVSYPGGPAGFESANRGGKTGASGILHLRDHLAHCPGLIASRMGSEHNENGIGREHPIGPGAAQSLAQRIGGVLRIFALAQRIILSVPGAPIVKTTWPPPIASPGKSF